MKTKNSLNYTSCIRDIEKKFADSYFAANKGWGQFLDGQIKHLTMQYGRYGTSSGAIVLAISGKRSEQISLDVKETLHRYFWDKEDVDKHSQNLVKASLFAGMACLNGQCDSLNEELEELLARRTTSNLWGDYWVGEGSYDQTESVFVSAIMLFSISCLLINNIFPQSEVQTLKQSLHKLESLYLEDVEKHSDYQEVVFAALGRYDFFEPSKKTRKQLKLNSTNPIDVSKKYIHFYDYEKEEGKAGREYYVVPKEIFSVLAGASNYSPANYTLRSIRVANELRENVKYNGGLYISSAGTRASTLEQGYLVLALDSLCKASQKKIKMSDKIIYGAKKDREEKFYFFTVLVVIAYSLSLLNSYFLIYNKEPSGEYDMILLTSSTYIMATIRDPQSILATLLGIKR